MCGSSGTRRHSHLQFEICTPCPVINMLINRKKLLLLDDIINCTLQTVIVILSMREYPFDGFAGTR